MTAGSTNGSGNGAADADTAVYAVPQQPGQAPVTQQPRQVRPTDTKPFPAWPQQDEPAPRGTRPAAYPAPDDGGADSWQSARRAPRRAGNPGDLQPGQPEPITTGRGARLGLRAAVISLTILAVLAAIGYGVYAYMRVPPLTDLSAQVVSNSQIDLGFPQTGILSRVLVHSGEHVVTGQVLAEETVAGLAQEVAADRQAVDNDEATIKQLNELLDEVSYDVSAASSVPGKTVVTTAPLEVDLANANSQLLRDRAQLAIAEATAAEEVIRAPAKGTVLSITGQPGEVVSGAGVASSGSTGGTVTVTPRFQLSPPQQSVAGSGSASPVVVVATGGPVLVNVVVPETQIRLVRLGSPATIKPTVSGLGPVSGTVTQIFSSSVVAAGVVSYEVQVTVVSHRGEDLLPGMTATAAIEH